MTKCAQSTSACLGVRICGMQVSGKGSTAGLGILASPLWSKALSHPVPLPPAELPTLGQAARYQSSTKEVHILIYDTLGFLKSMFQSSSVKTPPFFNLVSGPLAVETFHSGHVGPAHIENRVLMTVCKQSLGKELCQRASLCTLWISHSLNDKAEFLLRCYKAVCLLNSYQPFSLLTLPFLVLATCSA